MKPLTLLLTTVLLCFQAHAQAVFAHFMIGNVPKWVKSDWMADIRLAQQARIDAFVLNMAETDPNLLTSIDYAFQAAKDLNFKLFFSFDYAGGPPGGTWKDHERVSSNITKWKDHAAYYKHRGKPFVSTFEGHGDANDWVKIKAETGCLFIPSYSSLGARDAMKTGVPDGLFSWAGWSWGTNNMNTYVDESYREVLGTTREYMMPVSPWFYTNMPGFNKNWMWKGEDLWWDRWRDVMAIKPAFVQILTWNDYGESHYIGPLRPGTYGAFDEGKAPYNYALNMPHDGWRTFLPFYIDTYKNGRGLITKEGLTSWHRKHPKAACSDGDTTGNTASQLQVEFQPQELLSDRIFFSALLASPGTNRFVRVTIGSTSLVGEFTRIPDGGIGVYHGSVATNGALGRVTVTLRRDGVDIATVTDTTGKNDITTVCEQNIQNYNAWVGSSEGPTLATEVSPRLSLAEQECIQGDGAGEFTGICAFSCSYGYCPAACHCLKLGAPRIKPTSTKLVAYPAPGKGSSFLGLCKFACNLDKVWCTSSVCSLTSSQLVEPVVSPFLPNACIDGTGPAPLTDLCQRTCRFGYCPVNLCSCTARGHLVLSTITKPESSCNASATLLNNRDNRNICEFAGKRGDCPEGPCSDTCVSKFRTFKDRASTPAGNHIPSGLLSLESAGSSTKQYITIVNLTPYLFKHLKDQTHFYQMDIFDFDDIPAGHSRQCTMQYRGGNTPVDDKGEAYFEVVGTPHRFNIKARTNIPSDWPRRTIIDLSGWGRGQREYSDPWQEVGVTFVITGSQSYGYYDSLYSGDSVGWMGRIWDSVKDRQLRHFIMPGSHDSGMSKIGSPAFGGTALNTQNQGLNIYDQLRVGSRWFDLRVVRNGDKFVTAHVNNHLANVMVGAPGESLDDTIAGINSFTAEYPGEVVFLYISYLTNYVYTPTPGSGEPSGKYWSNKMMLAFYTELKRINNRCGNINVSEGKFDRQPMSTFRQDNRGCVIILLDGSLDKTTPIVTSDIPEGIYDFSPHMNWQNEWTESDQIETVVTKQLAAYRKHRHTKDNDNEDKLLVSQWFLTASTVESIFGTMGIQARAVWASNPDLYWAGFHGMTPETFPNVIMQDYIGILDIGKWAWNELGFEIRVLAMGMNLYMASENCHITSKHPLHSADGSSAARKVPSWNGIIYANGSRDDNPPADLNPWEEEVLKKGTLFANGTVAKNDYVAPDWDAANPWANTMILRNSTVKLVPRVHFN